MIMVMYMLKFGLSLYLVLRYLTIVLVVFLIVGTYKLESYGLIILIYYLAINYLAVKYGIINSIDRIKKIDKKSLFVCISLLLIISNVCIYFVYQFKLLEIILLTIIPVIMFIKIKTEKERQKIIELNAKETIDEYFKKKKK